MDVINVRGVINVYISKCINVSHVTHLAILFMIIFCVNVLYFKDIVLIPMFEVQYMFAADLFPVWT